MSRAPLDAKTRALWWLVVASGLLIALFVGALVWRHDAESWRCLDRGGWWDPEERRCELERSRDSIK